MEIILTSGNEQWQEVKQLAQIGDDVVVKNLHFNRHDKHLGKIARENDMNLYYSPDFTEARLTRKKLSQLGTTREKHRKRS